MLTWVALLRGVNVGGHNKVPMAALRQLAEDRLKWHDVQTYIASGNLVFRATGTSSQLGTELRKILIEHFDVDVSVMVLPKELVAKFVAACPFDPVDGRFVHGYFCWDTPVVQQARLAEWRHDEQLITDDRVVWLHTPGGFARSRVAKRLSQVVPGVEMTGRNLNTLRKIVEMLDAMDEG